MNKKIVSALAFIILIATTITPVFAHGHKSHSKAAVHYYGDGHNYHVVCPVENCTKANAHLHDGKTYYAHTMDDGHSYHEVSAHH